MWTSSHVPVDELLYLFSGGRVPEASGGTLREEPQLGPEPISPYVVVVRPQRVMLTK